VSAAVSLDGRVHLPIKTNTEIRTFRACPRRHKLAYVDKRRPRETASVLRFGSLWHLGQEAWFHCDGSPADRLEAGLVAMRGEDFDPYALVMAEELLLGYTARWGDAELRTVAVERVFTMPIVNPETGHASRTYQLGGKLDAIVAKTLGELYVLEHKTTSQDIEVGSPFWRRVSALDTQVSNYMNGARSLGFDVVSCIYDVVRKPGLRPLKATPVEARKFTAKGFLYANQRERDETPEEYRVRVREAITENPDRYFARGEVVRLEQDEKDHAFDVWQTTRLMREAELAGYAPKNPDACMQWGGCPYLRVCSGEASIDDDELFRTATEAHEELVPEEGEA
jgi:hypothetical protein